MLQPASQEHLTTVTRKGQITIPAAVRRHLGISKNQKLALVIEDTGSVRLKSPRYSSVAALQGAAGSLGKQMSWEQMRQIAHEDRPAHDAAA